MYSVKSFDESREILHNTLSKDLNLSCFIKNEFVSYKIFKLPWIDRPYYQTVLSEVT